MYYDAHRLFDIIVCIIGMVIVIAIGMKYGNKDYERVTTVDKIADGKYRREYGKWGVWYLGRGFIAFSANKATLEEWSRSFAAVYNLDKDDFLVTNAADWFLD